MTLTDISPDQVVLFELGTTKINATIVYTWVTMAVLVIGSWLVTRRLSTGPRMSRWQNLLEIVVNPALSQIRELSGDDGKRYLPFIGTLFVFIVSTNLLMIIPGYTSPNASLSTTAALALCVLVAVPLFGITSRGWRAYIGTYLKPSPFMLPFNLIGELSRTLALAVRLFGNVMSGAKIGGILLAVVPLFFPIVMDAFGLLTGVIQAYIFAILAMVYISSGTKAHVAKASSADGAAAGDEAGASS